MPQGDRPFSYVVYSSKTRDFGYINRLNPQKNKNNDIIVDLPEEKLWSKGNQYVEKVFSLYATIIETETKVCPNKKCNLRNYKDDDHLRSSYVEQNAAWIDQVFN